MKPKIEIKIILECKSRTIASTIEQALKPDNVDFPDGLHMEQKIINNNLEIYFISTAMLDSLLNTIDEILAMVNMTYKTLKDVI
jgi:hypothetical protein|tara:strand:- start:1724 stop:1975 length:252 start_codon:yes stop_codon:yes gene_type:complete